MNYQTQFLALAEPEAVFAATHQYKLDQNPERFFPSGLVRWRFRVLTEHMLGTGAVYDWKIRLLGVPVLAFREQIVEWQPARRVAYRAISGWEMAFKIDLEPVGQDTKVTVNLDISLGNRFLDSICRPVVVWGLRRVCRRGLAREGIRTVPGPARPGSHPHGAVPQSRKDFKPRPASMQQEKK